MGDDAARPVRDPKEFLVFGSPRLGEAEIQEVLECLRSGWIGTGPRVSRFEQAFRDYRRAAHAVAVNSCTAALHLSMVAAGAEPGSEVITTPLTFCSTVNAILHAGLRPVLADVDPESMCLDPGEVAARVTERTRIILPVHFAGRACAMDPLMEVAARHDLKVVEDCAHAIETEYRGRPVGTFGQFGCFSFYVTKNLVTGEGGMVLTERPDDADRIKILALHGMDKDAWKRFGDEGYKHYAVVECGFKYNMTDLQASLGLHQLERIEESWLRRREIWDVYQRELADLPLGLPAPPEADSRHAYHLYTVLVDEERAGLTRDAFLAGMTAENIGVGVHYRSIPTHPYYREHFGWRPEDYPQSHRIGEQTVSLPLSAKLTDRDVDDVLHAVRKILGGGS